MRPFGLRDFAMFRSRASGLSNSWYVSTMRAASMAPGGSRGSDDVPITRRTLPSPSRATRRMVASSI